MADIARLTDALRKADAAGNVEDARRLAAAIRAARAAPQVSFAGTVGGSRSTESLAERDAQGRLTDFGRRVEAQRQADRELYNPTAGQSFGQNLVQGFGKSFADAGRGIYQAGVDAANRGAGQVFTALDAIGADRAAQSVARNIGAPVNREARRLEEEEAERRRLDAPLMDTGGGLTGNVAGTVAQFVGPGIAARGTLAARALLPSSIRGNVGLGAVSGFLQPNAGAGDQAVNTTAGGVLGGAGAAVPRVAIATGGYLNRLRGGVSPIEQRAGERIVREATNPNAISFSRSSIPGEARTLGQETLDPGIMRLERQARQAQPDDFVTLDQANNAARRRFIESRGLSDDAYTQAVNDRQSQATNAFDRAFSAGNVEIPNAVSTIENLMYENRGNAAVSAGLERIRNELVRDVERAPGLVTPEQRYSDVRSLNNVRETINQLLSGTFGGDASPALKGSRALIELRDTLNNEIGDQVPAFTEALDAYRANPASRDISRTEMWRELANIGTSGEDMLGYQKLTNAAFTRATKDMDALAQKATGFGKQRADEVFRAEDFADIGSLKDSLRRVDAVHETPIRGSQTAGLQQQFAQQAGRDFLDRLGMFGAPVRTVLGALDSAEQAKVAYLIANPREAERVLARMSPPERAAMNRLLAQIAVSTPARAAEVTGVEGTR